MKIHFVLHAEFELLHVMTSWAKEKGFSVSTSRPFADDPLPELFDFDWLISLGGHQSSLDLDQYPYLVSEVQLIEEAFRAEKVVLGICLGAQLIGEALGAKAERSPYKEVGVFPIELTEEGKKDFVLQNLPHTFEVVHWHNDMPGLTKAAKVLATSPGCPRQIVRYTPKVYGLQCHLEPTFNDIKAITEHFESDLEPNRYVQKKEPFLKSDFAAINARLVTILDNILIQYHLEKETNHGYIPPKQLLKPFKIGIGTVQPIIESNTLELFTLTYGEEGATSEPHLHRHMQETFYVLSGTFRFRLNEQEMILQPGDSCTIQPNQRHQWTAIASDRGCTSWKLFVTCRPPGNQLAYLRSLASGAPPSQPIDISFL